MTRLIIVGGLVAALLIGGLGPSFAQSPAEIIEQRKDLFQVNRSAMGGMKKVFDSGGELAALVVHAQAIADSAAELPSLFPVGTESGDTKVRPTIWDNTADFEARFAKLRTDALQMLAVVESGDRSGAAMQFRTIGGNCGACHDEYRY